MRPVHQFTVVSNVPESLRAIESLAANLHWAWDRQLARLFDRLDGTPDHRSWRDTGQHPVDLVRRTSPACWDALADDEQFIEQLDTARQRLDDALDGSSWFSRRMADGDTALESVAYFSPEFGITEALPQYSGGLGVLAGDHLKASSDLGVPLIGVGLLYAEGYFHQLLDSDGWQQERNERIDPDAVGLHPTGVEVIVDLADVAVTVRVWRVDVGRIRLYLLDTNVPTNPPEAIAITDRLYGGDEVHRLRQEIVLGIGGVRALRALDIHPQVFHTNEGHAGFLGLERIREWVEQGLSFGEAIEAVVLKVDETEEKISLGMKQTEQDPWVILPLKYPVGTRINGKVRNLTSFGAFVEIEPGIDGLIHISDMSWTKRVQHPSEVVKKGDAVDVVILNIDSENKRISLGLKQAQSNPWNDFFEKNPVGTEVEGEVKNSTEFGLFIGLDGDVDGMVHMSDISWGVSGEEALALHHKGETVKAVVLDVDVEKERISLGMKQLERGGVAKPGTTGAASNKGETVTVTVLEVRDGGLDVQVGDDGATGFIKRTDLGRDRDEQRPERFQVGQKFDALVTGVDRSKKPTFSIKALQISEEKQAVAQYGSSDSGASLGDILGAALKEKQDKTK